VKQRRHSGRPSPTEGSALRRLPRRQDSSGRDPVAAGPLLERALPRPAGPLRARRAGAPRRPGDRLHERLPGSSARRSSGRPAAASSSGWSRPGPPRRPAAVALFAGDSEALRDSSASTRRPDAPDLRLRSGGELALASPTRSPAVARNGRGLSASSASAGPSVGRRGETGSGLPARSPAPDIAGHVVSTSLFRRSADASLCRALRSGRTASAGASPLPPRSATSSGGRRPGATLGTAGLHVSRPVESRRGPRHGDRGVVELSDRAETGRPRSPSASLRPHAPDGDVERLTVPSTHFGPALRPLLRALPQIRSPAIPRPSPVARGDRSQRSREPPVTRTRTRARLTVVTGARRRRDRRARPHRLAHPVARGLGNVDARVSSRRPVRESIGDLTLVLALDADRRGDSRLRRSSSTAPDRSTRSRPRPDDLRGSSPERPLPVQHPAPHDSPAVVISPGRPARRASTVYANPGPPRRRS